MHPPLGDLIVALIGIALMVVLAPVAVHELLDAWGDRHTDVRRAVMVAAGSLPVVWAFLAFVVAD